MNQLNNIQTDINNIWQDNFKYNDAGRSLTKWKGTNDCGIRAFALAHKMPYDESRKYLKAFTHIGKAGNRAVSTGIYAKDMDLAMESRGWIYHKAPDCGNRYAYYKDIPGIAVLDMPRHFSFVVHGMLIDTWDCSYKHVIGFWLEVAE